MENEISEVVRVLKSRNWLKYLAILFAVITLFQGFVIVQDGTVGVKRTFGAIDPEEVQPGVHFIIPAT